jgi:bla regulator protein BlaR1
MTELLSTLKLASLTSTAAILLVLLLRKTMQRYMQPRAIYTLWAVVPLATVMALVPPPTKFIAWQPVRPTAVLESAPSTVITPSDMPITHFSEDGRLFFELWLLGVGGTFLWFLLQQCRFLRGLGRLTAINKDVLRATTAIGCPSLIGLWRPLIVLPTNFEERYSIDEQQLILAHECHHRSSGDAQLNALCMAFRCLFWFNPLVHLAAGCFRLDQELACDAAVINRFGGLKRSYANALLKTQLAAMELPMGCTWTSSSAIAHRIQSLQRPVARTREMVIGTTVAAMLLTCGSYAAWAVQPQRTIYESPHVAEDIALNIVGQEELPAAPAARIGHAGRSAHSGATHQSVAPSIPEKSAKTTQAQPFATDETASQKLQTPASIGSGKPNLPAGPSSAPASYVSDIGIMESQPDSQKLLKDDHPVEEIQVYREMYSPRYPPEAIREKVQGSVVLKVHVDATGAPTSAEVTNLTPSTATNLASNSIVAVMNWRFTPAKRNGKSEPGIAVVPFDFKLSGNSDLTIVGEMEAQGAGLGTYRASYRQVTSIDYPRDKVDAGLQGVVQLKASVSSTGEVTSLSIDSVEPSSARALAEVAASAVRTWEFNPAQVGGKNVASTTTIPVVFSLESDTRDASRRARRANGLDPIIVRPQR